MCLIHPIHVEPQPKGIFQTTTTLYIPAATLNPHHPKPSPPVPSKATPDFDQGVKS